MDVEGADFEVFRWVLDNGRNRGGQVEKYQVWRRSAFIRACLDILNLGQENLFRDMWVIRPKVDKEAVAMIFRNVLLLRENIDLGYVFGSLEATGTWPAAGEDFFLATKELQKESLHHLQSKLQAWNVTDDLEDLDQWRASQVLCTWDRLRFWKTTSVPKVPSPPRPSSPPSDDGRWDRIASPGDETLSQAIVALAGQGDELGEGTLSCSPVVALVPR